MDRRIRFRATPIQISLYVGAMVVAWGLVVLISLRTGSASSRLPILAAAAVASCGAGAWLLRWRGLELTADGAVVRGDTVRRIPWAEVRDVRSRRRFGTWIVVIETDRHHVRCPAPFSGVLMADAHFEAKATYIQRWWRSCCPVVHPGPRGDTGWGRPVLPGDLSGRATGAPPSEPS